MGRQASEGVFPRIWLLKALAFYRPLGFFATPKGASDSKIADRVGAKANKIWSSIDVDASDPTTDLMLLSQDENRLWTTDVKSNEGGSAYEEMIEGLAKISRGSFGPKHVEEKWEGADEDQPVVSFTLGEWRYRIRLDNEGKYYDFGIFGHLNGIIAPTGLSFCIEESQDYGLCVCSLKPEEWRTINVKRKLEFKPAKLRGKASIFKPGTPREEIERLMGAGYDDTPVPPPTDRIQKTRIGSGGASSRKSLESFGV